MNNDVPIRCLIEGIIPMKVSKGTISTSGPAPIIPDIKPVIPETIVNAIISFVIL